MSLLGKCTETESRPVLGEEWVGVAAKRQGNSLRRDEDLPVVVSARVHVHPENRCRLCVDDLHVV